MSDQWDGKVVMSTPGGPIVTMSLGEVLARKLARKDAEIELLHAVIDKLEHECANLNNENHRLRARIAEYFSERDTYPMEET